MATAPQYFETNEQPEQTETASGRQSAPREGRDHFELRPLPFEDVYIYCKKQDNSRLVRQADPRAGGKCLSVIGAAGVILVLLGGVVWPNVANTVAGYKLEALRVEAQKMADEERVLQLQEAELLSPDRLEKLAQEQNLVTPTANQVVHLENKGDPKVAMLKP